MELNPDAAHRPLRRHGHTVFLIALRLPSALFLSVLFGCFPFSSTPPTLSQESDNVPNPAKPEPGHDIKPPVAKPPDASPFQPIRLFYARFNTPDFKAEDGQLPLAATNVQSVASFDGNGLLISSATPAYLKYRDRNNSGQPNLSLGHGTIRFLFKPDWTSAKAGGKGPGGDIQLISVGEWTPDASKGWWGLTISGEGNTIRFSSQTNGNGGTWAQGNLSLTSNRWHEFILAYNTKTSQIFVDQNRVANGGGILYWPGAEARAAYGFAIGSYFDGSQNARGTFDEFETYNYPLGLDKGYLSPLDWNYPPTMYALYEEDATLSARPLEDARAIYLHWRYGPNYHPSLSRRVFGQTQWTLLAANYKAWNFTDTALTPGIIYEYKLDKRSILSGWNLPAVEFRGRILLLIDQTLTNRLTANLNTLNLDLAGDGWKVTPLYVPRHQDDSWAANVPNIIQIKERIRDLYRQYSNDLKAVFIIGHVPIPRTGGLAPDGHHARPWPTDGYYADADETAPWTDTQSNIPANAPGDGLFDQNNYPSDIELMYGRVDYANMPAITGKTEAQLINDYLAKDHQYRHNFLQFSNRAYANGLLHSTAVFPNSFLYENAIRLTSLFQTNAYPILMEGNCLKNGQSALWGCLSGFGSYSAIDAGGPNEHSASQMASAPNAYHTAFYLLLGSYFGEWHATNDLLRAVISPSASGLGALWEAPDARWNLRKAGLGECLGEAVRETINNKFWPVLSQNVAYEWMGDPTLRLHVLPPPQNFSAKTSASEVMLSWTPVSDQNAACHIYRSLNGYQGDFVRLNPRPLSNSSFRDAPRPAGKVIYMLRSLEKIQTECGSYTNISQGVFTATD